MRILYAIFSGALWFMFLATAILSGIDISNETFFLTTSIVVAGALASGG